MKSNLLKMKSLLVLVLLVAAAHHSFSQNETTKIKVLDDVWVSEFDPTTNKDGETDMGVTLNDGDSRETYIKFDISKLYGKGGLVSAVLTMVGGQSNDEKWHTLANFYIDVYECSSDWSEKTITWENKVEPEGEIVAEASIHEPITNEIFGTDLDPEALKKCIEDAMRKQLQFVSFVIKAKEKTNGSRVWFSDKGWEPATLIIEQDILLEEPGYSEVSPENITLTSVDNVTAITEDNGTLQLISTITPAEASARVIWSVINETGEAKISPNGLVTAIKNGTVTVKVEIPDVWLDATMQITISGQDYTWDERNYVPNGTFSATGSWFGHLTIDDGVAVLKPDQEYETAERAPVWNFTTIPYAKKDLDFIFSFKMWAADTRSIFITMFDKTVGTYGTSTDAESVGGTSSWTIENIPMIPTWYTLHVNFANMPVECTQDLNFAVGLSTIPVYLDSVSLMTVEDFALKAPQQHANSLKVYPNPVGAGNVLTVSMTKMNEKVTIYNSLGQKVMEQMADGNIARFNVSSLKKGLYIVRLSDGTNEKFVR